MQSTRSAAERFLLAGDLDDPALRPWVLRHAARLGLRASITRQTPQALAMHVEGPPELLDAMEAGCLLGPIDSWIESIRRDALDRRT